MRLDRCRASCRCRRFGRPFQGEIRDRQRGSTSSAARVHLEIGAISEDIDDDGKLDAELSATSTGFAFDTGRFPAVLKVGARPCSRQPGEGQRGSVGTLTLEDADVWCRRGRLWRRGQSLRSRGSMDSLSFELDDAARAPGSSRPRSNPDHRGKPCRGNLGSDPDRQDFHSRQRLLGTEPVSDTVTVREVAEQFLSCDHPGAGNRLADVEPDAMDMFHPSARRRKYSQ